GKNSLNRLIRCVCGKKIGPDPRNFNQRVSLGRNDLLIRTFLSLFSEKDTQNLYLAFSCLSDRLTELLSMLTKKEQLVIRREYACHHPGG
ncbi:hypothetical protein LAW60_01105, partial [Escherichia coli]|nr:hypothetical protein [Escherichia coli]